MRLIIDVFEEDYEGAKQRWASGGSVHKMDYCVSKGIPFDSVIEEYVERGAITENMRMLDKIYSMRVEIEHIIPCDKEALSVKLGVLEIIDKHIADMSGKSCSTCKNSDDEFSGECYECIKGIFNHYESKESK